jgi:hypothetical protein
MRCWATACAAGRLREPGITNTRVGAVASAAPIGRVDRIDSDNFCHSMRVVVPSSGYSLQPRCVSFHKQFVHRTASVLRLRLAGHWPRLTGTPNVTGAAHRPLAAADCSAPLQEICLSHPLDRQGFRVCHSSTECLVAPIARVSHEWPSVRASLLVVFASLLILATAAPSSAQVLGASQLAIGRRGHTATLLNDGRILVVGGETAAGSAAQIRADRPELRCGHRGAGQRCAHRPRRGASR